MILSCSCLYRLRPHCNSYVRKGLHAGAHDHLAKWAGQALSYDSYSCAACCVPNHTKEPNDRCNVQHLRAFRNVLLSSARIVERVPSTSSKSTYYQHCHCRGLAHMHGALAKDARLTDAGSSTPSVTFSLSLTTSPENDESAIAIRLWPMALPLAKGCHVKPPFTMHSTVHAVTRWVHVRQSHV